MALQLLIQGPQPDERLCSVVDRACESYGVTRNAVFIEGGDVSTLALQDWDDLPSNLAALLAGALHCSVEEVAACAIKDGPEWLHPAARDVVCPLCLLEDANTGGAPYSRKAWSMACSTFCDLHRYPLYLAPSIPSDHMGLPYWDSELKDVALTAAMVNWEREVQGMAGDSPVRRLTALVAVNHDRNPGQPYGGGLRLVHGSWVHERWRRPRQEALGGIDPWAGFRMIAEPAYRRAAMYWAAVGAGLPWAIEYLPRAAAFGAAIRTHEEWWHMEFVPSLPDQVQDSARRLRREIGIGG